MKKVIKSLFTLYILLIMQPAFSAFMFQYSLGYHTHEDDVEQFTYSRMNNLIFIGAALDKNQMVILGQSIHIWSQEHATGGGTTSDISLMELGPRLSIYFNTLRNFSLNLTYNLYTKGERTLESESQEISGSSYMVGLSYQFRISKAFYMGASLNYHAVSIDTQTVETTETDVTNSYTSIVPTLDLNIRFQ